MKNNIVEIRYCSQCNWIFRATWMTQELLNTFTEELKSIVITPVTGGRYEVLVNGKEIYSLKEFRIFPQPKILKQMIRDEIAPEKKLGHGDSN